MTISRQELVHKLVNLENSKNTLREYINDMDKVEDDLLAEFGEAELHDIWHEVHNLVEDKNVNKVGVC